MAGMQTVTAATIGGALIFGTTLALFGQLKLAVARRGIAALLGGWLTALHIALIPLMLLSGILLDIYGARAVLVAGSMMLSVALVSLSLRQTYPHALAAMLLAGFGAAALGTASTVLMPRAFYPVANAAASPHSAAALHLGYAFIALGALLTPVLSEILLAKIELRRTLAVFALLSLIPAILGVLPSGEHGGFAEPHGDPAALFSQSACWLAALVLLFYIPLEASISMWTFTLLGQRGQDERSATGLLYGFWAAFVASRLLAAFALQTFSISSVMWDRTSIVVLPLLAAVLLGNLAGAGQHGRPGGGLILLGLLLGPILPALLGLLFRAAPHEKGTTFGLAFAAGSLGSGMLAQLLTPRFADPKAHSALRLPIFLALLVAATALVLGLMIS